jgi:hypothetical protein
MTDYVQRLRRKAKLTIRSITQGKRHTSCYKGNPAFLHIAEKLPVARAQAASHPHRAMRELRRSLMGEWKQLDPHSKQQWLEKLYHIHGSNIIITTGMRTHHINSETFSSFSSKFANC